MFSYTNSTYVDLAMKKLYFRKYGVRFLCDSHYLTVTEYWGRDQRGRYDAEMSGYLTLR